MLRAQQQRPLTGRNAIGTPPDPDRAGAFRRSPFHAFLGLSFTELEPGAVEVHLPFREELISNPDVPYLHGGVIGALLDVAGDYAIATRLGHGVPTIDMRVDFLRSVGREPLTASARIVKLGRTLGVADSEARNSAGEVVAVARILYSTRGRPSPSESAL